MDDADIVDQIDSPDICLSAPSRFTRTMQIIASLFAALLSLLPGFVGAVNLFFYVRNVMRGVDWLLVGIGALLLLLSLGSLVRPARFARWMGMIAVVGFAVVMASATGVLAAISSDNNISLLCAGSLFFVFLLSRYLAKPHFQNSGAACSHCSH